MTTLAALPLIIAAAVWLWRWLIEAHDGSHYRRRAVPERRRALIESRSPAWAGRRSTSVVRGAATRKGAGSTYGSAVEPTPIGSRARRGHRSTPSSFSTCSSARRPQRTPTNSGRAT